MKPILTFLLCIATIDAFAQKGDELFKANCGACHTIGNGRLVGPDLSGVDKKHSEAYLLKWIKSSQSVIKSGDTAAIALNKQYNGIVMPDMPLSEPEIKSIIGYIKIESLTVVVSADTVSVSSEKALVKNTVSSGSENAQTIKLIPNPDAFFNYCWIGLGVIFILVLFLVLAGVIKNLSDTLKKEKP